jgi:uncharacterized membrane protein
MDNQTKQIGWYASAFFLAWVVLAVVAALPGSEGMRGLFSSVCHQSPERCYSVCGHPVGLCVRCICMYIGLAAGHLVFARVSLAEKGALRLLALAAVLMAGDVFLEWGGLYRNLKQVRAFTGCLFGFACAWFALRGLSELWPKRKSERTIYESN